MSLTKKTLHGAGILAFGQGAGQVLSFVRNIIVARLLVPEQFGIAATFAIAISLLQMMSDLALDKLLIQDPEGDSADFLGCAHLLQAARGILIALILLLGAPSIARLFGAAEATWAFRMLALVPLFRGFAHLDIARFQRGMRFGPMVTVELVSQCIALAVAIPLGLWLHDYSLALWLVLLQSFSAVVLSHILAESSYRWNIDKIIVRKTIAFGGPLLLNGLLMFGALQGDRALVGSIRGLTDLGYYSVAVTLALMPSLLLARIVTSLVLPILSRVQDRPAEFQNASATNAEAFGIIAIFTGMLMSLAGPFVVPLVYGSQYTPAARLMYWFGILIAVRLLRYSPTLVCMSRADTNASLWSNIARSVSLPFAATVLALNWDLTYVVIAGVVGELCGFTVVLVRVARKHGVSIKSDCVLLGIMALLTILTLGLSDHPITSAGLVAAIGICASLFMLPHLRHQINRLIVQPVVSR